MRARSAVAAAIPCVAAYLISTATLAHAETPNQRAEREARSFLLKCSQREQDLQGICAQNQSNFMEQYIRAKAGDVSAIGSIASSFRPPWPGEREDLRREDVGYPVNAVQACAWRILWFLHVPLPENSYDAEWRKKSNATMVKSYCDPLLPAEQTAARRRAEVLENELRTSPTTKPIYHRPPTAPVTDPAGKRAQAEARKFLAPCQQDPEYAQLCRKNGDVCDPVDEEFIQSCKDEQADFVDEYVRARSNDPVAMDSVALTLSRPDAPALRNGRGIAYDNVQSCAWSLVRDRQFPAAEAHQAVTYNCGHLTAPDQQAAHTRAEGIAQSIRKDPVHPLPPKERLLIVSPSGPPPS